MSRLGWERIHNNIWVKLISDTTALRVEPEDDTWKWTVFINRQAVKSGFAGSEEAAMNEADDYVREE